MGFLFPFFHGSQSSQGDQANDYWEHNFCHFCQSVSGLVSIDFLFIDVKIVDIYGTCCAVLSPALCWHRARTNNRWDSFCQQLQCWMGILSWERFRSSSSYQSSEASEIMHLKVLFDLHHSDSSPLNGSGNGELIFVYRLEDFPWFPIKTSLSLRPFARIPISISKKLLGVTGELTQGQWWTHNSERSSGEQPAASSQIQWKLGKF